MGPSRSLISALWPTIFNPQGNLPCVRVVWFHSYQLSLSANNTSHLQKLKLVITIYITIKVKKSKAYRSYLITILDTLAWIWPIFLLLLSKSPFWTSFSAFAWSGTKENLVPVSYLLLLFRIFFGRNSTSVSPFYGNPRLFQKIAGIEKHSQTQL